MNKKRTNPARRLASQADVARARRDGQLEGARFMAGTIFMDLRDKSGLSVEELQQAWAASESLWSEVAEGRVSFPDILRTIREEDGIVFNI